MPRPFPSVVLTLLTCLLIFPAFADSEPESDEAPDPESQTEPPQPLAPSQEFPAELAIPLEAIPPPVQRTILQRIDDHERIERMLTDQPRDIPREIDVIQREDHLIIRMR